MHELDGHRPLADRGSDAFDRVGPHVAGREYAGAAGLEQKRLPLAGPVRGLRQRRTGHDEALGVPLDLRREPVGPWYRADKAEHRRRALADLRLVVSGGVVHAPPFELLATLGVQPAILDARGDQ